MTFNPIHSPAEPLPQGVSTASMQYGLTGTELFHGSVWVCDRISHLKARFNPNFPAQSGRCSQSYRVLDAEIQAANWQTDLID